VGYSGHSRDNLLEQDGSEHLTVCIKPCTGVTKIGVTEAGVTEAGVTEAGVSEHRA
jgi:hypothetical protein